MRLIIIAYYCMLKMDSIAFIDGLERTQESIVRYSPESLEAFVESALRGSFSAAARQLGKTQSTVSTAVANLEIDLGITLFDRSQRYPRLTQEGQKVLGYAEEVLAADSRLRQLSIQLTAQVESRLTLVFSDVFQPDPGWKLLHQFGQRFPHTELEWLDAEGGDVIDYILSGRAQLGLLSRREQYPPEIVIQPLTHSSEVALFVHRDHPLAQREHNLIAELNRHRRIRISYHGIPSSAGPVWSASDYIAVLEMVMAGLGWAELPRELVALYGDNSLVELPVSGWPRSLQSDAVRRRDTTLGPAGLWWLDAFKALET
ncbi:HTH-type transcriptional regulator HdfR [Carnimonas sp. R-84865]